VPNQKQNSLNGVLQESFSKTRDIGAFEGGYVMTKACFKTGIIGIVAILTLAPGIACAKDYCLAVIGNFKLVGQRFTIPKKGQCTRWTGFTRDLGGTLPSVGTGCTASNGLKLSFTILTEESTVLGSVKLLDSITLSLSSQNGFDYRNGIDTGGTPALLPMSGFVCSKNTLPALSREQEPLGDDTKTP